MSDTAAYFERETATRFRPTAHVGGAWNTDEQHIAPSLGLIAHAIEGDHRQRRGDDRLRLSRVSYDILGVLPIEPVDIAVTVLRAGRTIELMEARLDHAGRTAVIARAWLMHAFDTADLAGSTLPQVPAAEELPAWDPTTRWPGGFIRSAEVRRASPEPGRATSWVRTRVKLIAEEQASPTARVLGLVDIANGIATRVHADEAVFPNLDLTVHLFGEPDGEWTGFDTTVSFGRHGAGLTHSVLHDKRGPFGTMAQALTVRPA